MDGILPPASLVDAPCQGEPAGTFYPPPGAQALQRARDLCASCAAESLDRWADCATYVLSVERACGVPEVHGYAAGMTAGERRVIVADGLPI